MDWDTKKDNFVDKKVRPILRTAWARQVTNDTQNKINNEVQKQALWKELV